MIKFIVGAVLALSLATGGMVATLAHSQADEEGFTCPITGEQLPCPKCCPLK